jgi:hypothetical protein
MAILGSGMIYDFNLLSLQRRNLSFEPIIFDAPPNGSKPQRLELDSDADRPDLLRFEWTFGE